MNLVTQRKENGSRRVSFHPNVDNCHVEQQHSNDADINQIIKRYRKTGVLPDPNSRGVYGDFSNAEDYHDTQNRLIDANSQFLLLPSDLRSQFLNDAGLFYEYVNNPDNLTACQDLGLLARDPTKTPVPPTPDKPPTATAKEAKGDAEALPKPSTDTPEQKST